MALFYQLEEAGADEAEDGVPLRAPAPKAPPVAADPDMKEILIRLVQAQAAKTTDSASISQRDATKVLQAVPTVAPNGVAKTGAKLLAWISVCNGTYLKDAKYFTTDYAFNLTRSLFAASPQRWRLHGIKRSTPMQGWWRFATGVNGRRLGI
jgi:hypothetical protein